MTNQFARAPPPTKTTNNALAKCLLDNGLRVDLLGAGAQVHAREQLAHFCSARAARSEPDKYAKFVACASRHWPGSIDGEIDRALKERLSAGNKSRHASKSGGLTSVELSVIDDIIAHLHDEQTQEIATELASEHSASTSKPGAHSQASPTSSGKQSMRMILSSNNNDNRASDSKSNKLPTQQHDSRATTRVANSRDDHLVASASSPRTISIQLVAPQHSSSSSSSSSSSVFAPIVTKQILHPKLGDSSESSKSGALISHNNIKITLATTAAPMVLVNGRPTSGPIRLELRTLEAETRQRPSSTPRPNLSLTLVDKTTKNARPMGQLILSKPSEANGSGQQTLVVAKLASSTTHTPQLAKTILVNENNKVGLGSFEKLLLSSSSTTTKPTATNSNTSTSNNKQSSKIINTTNTFSTVNTNSIDKQTSAAQTDGAAALPASPILGPPAAADAPAAGLPAAALVAVPATQRPLVVLAPTLQPVVAVPLQTIAPILPLDLNAGASAAGATPGPIGAAPFSSSSAAAAAGSAGFSGAAEAAGSAGSPAMLPASGPQLNSNAAAAAAAASISSAPPLVPVGAPSGPLGPSGSAASASSGALGGPMGGGAASAAAAAAPPPLGPTPLAAPVASAMSIASQDQTSNFRFGSTPTSTIESSSSSASAASAAPNSAAVLPLAPVVAPVAVAPVVAAPPPPAAGAAIPLGGALQAAGAGAASSAVGQPDAFGAAATSTGPQLGDNFASGGATPPIAPAAAPNAGQAAGSGGLAAAASTAATKETNTQASSSSAASGPIPAVGLIGVPVAPVTASVAVAAADARSQRALATSASIPPPPPGGFVEPSVVRNVDKALQAIASNDQTNSTTTTRGAPGNSTTISVVVKESTNATTTSTTQKPQLLSLIDLGPLRIGNATGQPQVLGLEANSDRILTIQLDVKSLVGSTSTTSTSTTTRKPASSTSSTQRPAHSEADEHELLKVAAGVHGDHSAQVHEIIVVGEHVEGDDQAHDHDEHTSHDEHHSHDESHSADEQLKIVHLAEGQAPTVVGQAIAAVAKAEHGPSNKDKEKHEDHEHLLEGLSVGDVIHVEAGEHENKGTE